jgi:hypothetical protein
MLFEEKNKKKAKVLGFSCFCFSLVFHAMFLYFIRDMSFTALPSSEILEPSSLATSLESLKSGKILSMAFLPVKNIETQVDKQVVQPMKDKSFGGLIKEEFLEKNHQILTTYFVQKKDPKSSLSPHKNTDQSKKESGAAPFSFPSGRSFFTKIPAFSPKDIQASYALSFIRERKLPKRCVTNNLSQEITRGLKKATTIFPTFAPQKEAALKETSWHKVKEGSLALYCQKSWSYWGHIPLLEKKSLFSFQTAALSYEKNVTFSFFDHLRPLFGFATTVSVPNKENMKILSCGKEFDIQVSYAEQKNQEGIIFAITMIPKKEMALPKIPQNFFFLIDKSNAITTDRLTKTRHAVAACLSALPKKDLFNILTFDHQLELFSQKPQHPEGKILLSSKKFLLQQTVSSFFSMTNIFRPLFKTLTKNPVDNQLNTVILLSNGEDWEKLKNLKILRQWTRNQGKNSLYVVSVAGDKNIPVMDFFSACNKGKLFIASNPSGIKRQMQKLVRSIQNPIAKNVTPSFISLSEDNEISLFPVSRQFSHLYQDQPYIILGTAKKKEDFLLLLQGQGANEYFHIKKMISFEQAQEGGQALEEQWAIQKSYYCYEQYFFDGNPQHMVEAKKILEPYHLETIFR